MSVVQSPKSDPYGTVPLQKQYRLEIEATPRFVTIWLVTLIVSALFLIPASTICVYNNFQSINANFIEGLYLRKDNAAHLLTAPGKPAIFYVAGSSGLFGFDASLAQRKLGRTVINYATHAGLTLDYILTRSKRLLLRGDIVILAPELGLLFNPDQSSTDVLWEYYSSFDRQHYFELPIRQMFPTFYSLSFSDYGKAVINWNDYLRGAHFQGQSAYNILQLSRNGDFNGVAGRPASYPPAGALPPEVPRLSRALIENYLAWAKSHGIRVMFAMQPVAYDRSEIAIGEPGFRALLRYYTSLGVPVLETPAQCAYPKAWFLDTRDHANSSVRRVRTERLIRKLSAMLGVKTSRTKPSVYALNPLDHKVEDINFFADRPDMEYRLFDPQEAYHPDGINAENIKALRDNGTEVFLDNNPMALDLAAFGLDSILTAERQYELSGVFRETRHTLYFLCNAVSSPWIHHALSGAPEPIRTAAAGKAPWVAIYDSEDNDLTELRQREDSAINRVVSIRLPSGRRTTLPAKLNARSGSCSISLNGWEYVARADALTVIALDTDFGVISNVMSFSSPVYVAAQLYQAKASQRTPLGTADLPLDDFAPTGWSPPIIRAGGKSRIVQFTGAESVWGWYITNRPFPGREMVLTLNFQILKPGKLDLVLLSNELAFFQDKPEPVAIADGATFATIRLRLRPGVPKFPEGKWITAGLRAAAAGAEVEITSATATWYK